MKHPTASADLAGRNRTMSTGGPFDAVSPIFMDGDALAGSNMAREMAQRIRLDPATIDMITIPDSHMPKPGETLAQLRARVHLDPSAISGTGHATHDYSGILDIPRASDPRKPWTEPTVTECATTNRRPATLTVASVDLPNPQPIDDLISELTFEARWLCGDDAWGNTDWHAGPKGLDGKSYAFHIRAAIAEIQRQAAEIARLDGAVHLNQAAFSQANASLASAQSEIAELQGMLEEAIGPVRLVSGLATMTDTECDFMDAGDLRLRARGQLDGDFTMPRMYDGEDRKRAVEAVLADRPKTNPLLAMEVVDIVAEALGLRRAS